MFEPSQQLKQAVQKKLQQAAPFFFSPFPLYLPDEW